MDLKRKEMSYNNILLLNKLLLFPIVLSIVALNACRINAANPNKYEEYERDRVMNLPGQPKSPSVSQFSGYVTVNKAHGRALFYWFFEAQSQPNNKPLLLWLNGGPGCSSVGYGAAVELGPLRVSKMGAALEFNQYSWNKEANLLFLESPIGVGFSYTNTSSDFTNIDDTFAAKDAYNFLVNWLKRFPQFKSHQIFIAGESYAGHYVPQLAELVYDRNKIRNKYPYINLIGFIVGNPETDDYYDYKGIVEYAWSHSVISDEEYKRIVQACDFRLAIWSNRCIDATNVMYDSYDAIDMYNIYAPSCPKSNTSSSKAQNKMLGRMKQIRRGGYDPCYSKHVETYFNRIDVQIALHVNSRPHINNGRVKWKTCNDSVLYNYNYTVFSILPIYKKLIKGGLKIWVYSGDADGRVPFIATRYCIEALRLPLKTNLTSWWFLYNQVGGKIVEYEGLTYVTVRGAGHLVPLYKPKEALALIHSYLSSQPLSTHT